MEDGRVHPVVAWKAGQKRAFFQRKILELLSEIKIGGGGDTVNPKPEIVLVAVESEDLSLGITPLDFPCQEDLLYLAIEGLLWTEKQQPRQLLRDCACAFRLAHGNEVFVGGADHRVVVDSGMVEKLVVFGSQESIQIVRGDIFPRNDDTPLYRELADHFIVIGINIGDDVGSVVLQTLNPWQAVVVSHQETRDNAHEHEAENEKTVENQQPGGKFACLFPWKKRCARCHGRKIIPRVSGAPREPFIRGEMRVPQVPLWSGEDEHSSFGVEKLLAL